MAKLVAWDFLVKKQYEYTDGEYTIEAPEDYKPFGVSHWPNPSGPLEFVFIRPHVKIDRRLKKNRTYAQS